MEIFYINLKNTKDIDKISKKELQSTLGRKLTEQIAKVFYNVKDTSIIIDNKKPKFKNSNLCFNISHSNNVIAIAFDELQLGLDVEFMQERDFKAISKRYNLKESTKENFYKFWTQYEAEIKIQAEIKQKISFELQPNYMLSIVSANQNLNTQIKMYEINENANVLNEKSIRLSVI